MVEVIYDKRFQNIVSKIKDTEVQKSIKNKITKIIEDPETGKPMRYGRKGTREVYVGSSRLAYAFYKDRNIVEFLDFYHKDEQ